MNESDWLSTSDPLALLDYLFPIRGLDSTQPQSRASRLYLLGCARLAWDRLPGVCQCVAKVGQRVYGGRMRDTVLRDTIYPHAEALIHCRGTADEVNSIGRELVALGLATAAEVFTKEDIPPEQWSGFAHLVYLPFARTTPHFRRIPVELHSLSLVREVFANPFRQHLTFNRDWLTENVLNLARHAEATADFAVLPVLADALQDAGCDRDDVLDHLRSGGPHMPGCWAIEWVLNQP